MSSGLTVRDIVVRPNETRDWRFSYAQHAEDLVVDLWQEYKVVGLDWSLRNWGANNIEVAVDAMAARLVAPGDAMGETNIKFSLLNINVGAGAELFDLVVAGVRTKRGIG